MYTEEEFKEYIDSFRGLNFDEIAGDLKRIIPQIMSNPGPRTVMMLIQFSYFSELVDVLEYEIYQTAGFIKLWDQSEVYRLTGEAPDREEYDVDQGSWEIFFPPNNS
jgi:hypothetical protein